MRPLFIASRSSSARSWRRAVLALALLSGAAAVSWGAHGEQAVQAMLQLWERVQSTSEDEAAILTEPGPLPVVAESASQPMAQASDAALAAAPEASVAPPESPDEVDRQVLTFVERWAASWSAKDLNAYFAAYSEQFQPEGKKSLAQWMQERKQRIAAKARIAVQIKDFTIVSSDHSGLKASFIQTYEADGFRSVSAKVLLLSKQDGAWQIVREYTP